MDPLLEDVAEASSSATPGCTASVVPNRPARPGGYVTEAAQALTRFAFGQLHARRVELRMDDANERSWRVAQRAGFAFEGVLRSDSLSPAGLARDTRVYALTGAGPVAASGADP